MVFTFKKIASVTASVAMVSTTVALAAAASYPAPFVQNGAANVAVVYGAGYDLDLAAANDVQASLSEVYAEGAGTSGGDSTVTGGDFVQIERSSTKFHVGDGIKTVLSRDITDQDLEVLLADGTFRDENNDEFDYTQKVSLSNLTLTMFEDNDYKEDVPTIGFRVASGEAVLNYTLDFSERPVFNATDMETTELQIMDKTYYVLDVTGATDATAKLTLLDSANSIVVTEGETTTANVGGETYEVSITYVGSSEVKLSVNGETTNTLNEGETYKLTDGTYVGVKDILYNAKDTGTSSVEISVGSGKLELRSQQELKINDDSVSGLMTYIDLATGSDDLDTITIEWKTDEDEFVTEDSSMTMPGFGSLKLSYGGLAMPAEEEISVENDGDDAIALASFPLQDSVEDIPLLYSNGTNYIGIGKDATSLLRTSDSGSVIFDEDTDDYLAVSWTDGDDAESYLLRATSFETDTDAGVNRTDIQYRKDQSWVNALVDAEPADTVTLGNVELTVGTIDKNAKTVNLTRTSSTVSFETLYSEEGLKVTLPVSSTTSGAANAVNFTNAQTAYSLVFAEEDKDENKGSGTAITVTLGLTGTSPNLETYVSSVSGGGASSTEIEDTDVYRNVVYSALATEILHDQGPDQDTVKLVYHGSEVEADVFLTAVDATVSGDGSAELGSVTYSDSEASELATKNLIVVGGTCVNSVAADLLGVSPQTCGDDWESATGVGANQFLIETFDRGNGRLATLVAGYNAGDTQNAVTYLTNEEVEVEAGKKYIGTSATSADLVV